MKAGDLKAITLLGEGYPELLPYLLNLYRLGYKQGQIDAMKKDISRFEDKVNDVFGINYGSEMKPNN